MRKTRCRLDGPGDHPFLRNRMENAGKIGLESDDGCEEHRCTDPEEMPEMEARPPAENRHGGAPRGERPALWDAPRLTRAD